MDLVVDASVAVKWYVDEAGSALAKRFLDDDRFTFVLPCHALGEIGNALVTYIRRGMISASQARATESAIRDDTQIIEINSLLSAAIDIAVATRQTAYDAIYVALADKIDSFVVTADRRMVDSVKSTAWESRVRHFETVPLS
jgi:predicted nucleic acid-binding protein